jgi:hypothetical protein
VIGLAIIEAAEEVSELYRKEQEQAITWVRPSHAWLEIIWHKGICPSLPKN